MWKMPLLATALAGALSLGSAIPANAFLPSQSPIAAAHADQSDVVVVKRSKWKKRPPGWSRGKARWKRGGGVPPGQR